MLLWSNFVGSSFFGIVLGCSIAVLLYLQGYCTSGWRIFSSIFYWAYLGRVRTIVHSHSGSSANDDYELIFFLYRSKYDSYNDDLHNGNDGPNW